MPATWLKSFWLRLRPAAAPPAEPAPPGALTDNQRDNRTLTDSYRRRWSRLGPWAWLWNYRLPVLTVGALIAVVAVNRGGFAVSRHSPHPLSRAHAAWEARCDVCHAPAAGESGSLVASALAVAPAQSARCRGCHPGPEHHTRCRGLEAECSTCHREHRGADASLVRHDDHHCTRCHGTPASEVAGGGAHPAAEKVVTSFTREGHPPFRPLAHDPGALEFNHALHMTRGLVRAKGDKRPFTLAQVAKEARPRYRESGKDGVQLECASCHQADREDWTARPPSLPEQLRPARSRGDYLLPVVYEAHCQACHPLTFDARLPGRAVPHRLQPGDVRRHLEGVYADEYLRDNAALREQWLPQWPLPGKLPRPTGEATIGLRRDVDKAEGLLFRGKTGCAECHRFNGDPDKVLPDAVVPTAVPAVWLPHATFGHAAHRALDCRGCHANADATRPDGTDNPEASRESKTVLIPNIGTCLGCHKSGPDGKPLPGMARADCAGCHRYHDEGRPLAGVGSAARAPREKPGLPGLPRGP